MFDLFDLFNWRDIIYYLGGVIVGCVLGRSWPSKKSQEEKEAP